jgi:hypothetical protein
MLLAAGIAGPICFAGSFLSYMSFDVLWWVTKTGRQQWQVVHLYHPEWGHLPYCVFRDV